MKKRGFLQARLLYLLIALIALYRAYHFWQSGHMLAVGLYTFFAIICVILYVVEWTQKRRK